MKFKDTPFCAQEFVFHPMAGHARSISSRGRGPGRALSRLAAAALLLAAGAAAQAAPVLWSGNGHYYEQISGSYNWNTARTAAAALSFNGMRGYLATITSAAENSFLAALAGTDVWIGGSDTQEEGTWKWVDGPEAGQTFYVEGAAVQPGYSSWAPGEPNGFTGENSLQFYYSRGIWNDHNGAQTMLPYIVEYSPAAVPEPGTLALLGAGGVSALARRRRKSL